MTTFRWIVNGILAGAMYYLLVTTRFTRTFAIAWPDWYHSLFESQLRPGVFLWDLAMGSPAVLFATLIGFMLTKVVNRTALRAAIIGAATAFLYAVLESTGNGWLHASTFVVVGLLPLSTFLMERRIKTTRTDKVSK